MFRTIFCPAARWPCRAATKSFRLSMNCRIASSSWSRHKIGIRRATAASPRITRVKYRVLDARQLGLNANVILDACRGIDLEAGDIDLAIKEMEASGATVLQSGDVRDERD